MTVNYRRTALDRDTTFYIPKVECFACYDSGLVSNSDGFVNRFIPDYDRDKKGNICGGQDLAIICHCKAAYEKETDEDKTKKGFRDNHGNINTVLSIRGEPQPVGFSMEKEKIRQIHTERKQNWEKTAKDVNQLRNKRANGEKVETPYYIEVVKENLTKVDGLFSFPSEKAIVKSMQKTNDKN